MSPISFAVLIEFEINLKRVRMPPAIWLVGNVYVEMQQLSPISTQDCYCGPREDGSKWIERDTWGGDKTQVSVVSVVAPHKYPSTAIYSTLGICQVLSPPQVLATLLPLIEHTRRHTSANKLSPLWRHRSTKCAAGISLQVVLVHTDDRKRRPKNAPNKYL